MGKVSPLCLSACRSWQRVLGLMVRYDGRKDHNGRATRRRLSGQCGVWLLVAVYLPDRTSQSSPGAPPTLRFPSGSAWVAALPRSAAWLRHKGRVTGSMFSRERLGSRRPGGRTENYLGYIADLVAGSRVRLTNELAGCPRQSLSDEPHRASEYQPKGKSRQVCFLSAGGDWQHGLMPIAWRHRHAKGVEKQMPPPHSTHQVRLSVFGGDRSGQTEMPAKVHGAGLERDDLLSGVAPGHKPPRLELPQR